jgi:Activator of Hsp90 ATPase homolog 1-like protein
MPKVQYSITIKAPIHKVWEAITTTEIAQQWTGSVIKTDWKVGSQVDYTCYNEDCSIMIYEGRTMKWIGTIAVLEEDSRYLIIYPEGAEHCSIDEEYSMEKIDEQTTILHFTSNFTNQEIADDYAKGVVGLFKDLQKMLEN